MYGLLKQGVCAAVFAAGLGAGAQAENLRLLTSWDMTHLPNIHMVEEFAERLEERTGGKMQVTVDGPEVVAPFDQAAPVQAGIFQMLFTNPAYHTGTTWAGYALNSSYDPGPEARREMGLWDALDEAYQEVGLKLIALPGTGNGGFQFVLTEPPKESDMPFTGMKIRGSPSYKPIIEALGGVLVVLSGGEIYAAMDRGVVEGAGWPVIGMAATRLAEVAKYYVRPAFASDSYFLLMNLDAWNSLDGETQQTMLDIGAELERESREIFAGLKDEEVAAMQEAGMKEAPFSETAARNMTQALSSGQRERVRESGTEAARRIIDILEENDL